MIQPDQQHRFSLIHCLFVLLLITETSAQICQNDVPDFFYNVSFAGPLFDQTVYVLTASNFSVASPNRTTVFPFSLRRQTDFSRPSFVPTTVTGRALNNIPNITEVNTDNPSFSVVSLGNDNYNLVTNT